MTKGKPSARTNSPLARHRAVKARQGFVRLEVSVRREDAGLVRGLAAALSDPERGVETRAVLRRHVGGRPAIDLKALLAAAPLDGIEIERSRDIGRTVDL